MNNIRFFYLTMVFTVEHKTFLIESSFRNGTKIGRVWVYSVQNCIEKFQTKFPNFAVDYIQFKTELFHGTGSVLQKPGSGAV
jgi:hypothetical protein